MRIENSFEVPASEQAAWDLLMDVPRVIPCMPGAELVEAVGDSEWKARVRVRLGPISLTFLADVRRDEVDEAAHRVRLRSSAREERGRGAADATIESWLGAADGRTRVDVVTDLTLTGPLTQYGRGVVPDVAAQLVRSFSECLEQQLAAPPAVEEEVAAVAVEQPAAPAPRPAPGLAIGLRALRSAVARLVRRLLRRRQA